MKFVTLALVTLLALGSQAASLQADAPNDSNRYLQEFRDYLTFMVKQFQAKGHAIANRVADPETKELIGSKVNEIVERVQTLRGNTEPLTDGLMRTFSEATADLQTKLKTDFDNLRDELAPMREELRTEVLKHIDQYREKLAPMLLEAQMLQQQNTALLKEKYEPMLRELPPLVSANVEETKQKLMPIFNTLSAKIGEQVEYLRGIAAPYVDDYKEHMRNAYAQAQEINHEKIMENARPHIETLRACLDDFANKMKTVME